MFILGLYPHNAVTCLKYPRILNTSNLKYFRISWKILIYFFCVYKYIMHTSIYCIIYTYIHLYDILFIYN